MKPALFRARTFPAIGLLPLGHASLDGVRGIPFLGCTYAGTIYGNPADASLRNAGTGVNAVNSSFIVGSKCTVVVPYGTPCPPANLYKTTFTGLAQGVQATSLDPGKTFSVDEATFTNCPRGIRMEGVSNAAITRNNFAVNDFTGSYYQFSVPYGAYSDQCTGYKIENNVFTSNHPHTPHTGLVIKDSGPNSNTVYNNRFDGFYEQNSTALLIQGNNAAPNGQLTGLEVRCNEFGQ
ncbi:MAG: right-handed parallel beta-helix repeat-containing protein, partial [Bacteroidetes bacterium]|nr:right-handed parallel beta-helix repeat-containing protein [Bacteroidota bacterium]